MAFESAGIYLFTAAKKYNLHRQAIASITCERVTQFVQANFPDFVEAWVPLKFEDGVLTIQACTSAASGELFMRTHEILEKLSTADFPRAITQIRIVKQCIPKTEY